ncbi:hypothetical protein RRG08_006100 [Elysia crispata]|uniref:Uncharacterized protein n=1 Tax=Elysia crispata TaxID=231223 RepID=A0AAE1AAX7_9GAST|nr:hypothetical protein RRG08_006100 [Elysia crispata]
MIIKSQKSTEQPSHLVYDVYLTRCPKTLESLPVIKQDGFAGDVRWASNPACNLDPFADILKGHIVEPFPSDPDKRCHRGADPSLIGQSKEVQTIRPVVGKYDSLSPDVDQYLLKSIGGCLSDLAEKFCSQSALFDALMQAHAQQLSRRQGRTTPRHPTHCGTYLLSSK